MKPNYKIIKKIGEGEHGSIFLVTATHQQDGIFYAMKKVAFNSYTNYNEFELLPTLSHPNIIKVIDREKNETGYTLYQEYASEGSFLLTQVIFLHSRIENTGELFHSQF